MHLSRFLLPLAAGRQCALRLGATISLTVMDEVMDVSWGLRDCLNKEFLFNNARPILNFFSKSKMLKGKGNVNHFSILLHLVG